ncbi:hypothetical protein [Salmonella phage PHA46]
MLYTNLILINVRLCHRIIRCVEDIIQRCLVFSPF